MDADLIVDPKLRWADNRYQVWLDPVMVDGIALHHIAAKNASVETVHNWHLQNGWSGIGYNYYIRKDGTIYRGRGSYQGAGILNHNEHLVHISFEGDFENIDTSMPDVQYNAGVWTIEYAKSIFPNVCKVDGHKAWQPNACPGKNFPLQEMIAGKYRGEEKSEEQVSDWAKSAWEKAIAKGIIKGDGTNFNPQGTVTREALIVILDRIGYLD